MSDNKSIQGLAKDTAIYGISNILGKFLNWCLVPLYTYVLTSSADYGIVTNLYAWTALLLVILTYGMETGFFRFANSDDPDAAQNTYSSVLRCVAFTSVLFAAAVTLFSGNIADWLNYNSHPEYIIMMGVIVAIDAFDCIPFAYLRYKKRPIRFAILKLITIVINIAANLFFLVVCPYLKSKNIGFIDTFYNPDYGVGYVFISNFISTIAVTLLLLPEILAAKSPIDGQLLRRILKYSLPLLVLGIAGIMNQTIDKIIYPYLFEDANMAQAQLGIYGACFKVAMVMMVFTQAFRYAYEPFVFAQNKSGDKKNEYALAMKYFVIFSLLIFLGMVLFVDALKILIRSDYWEGLRIVPIVLLAYIFQGIYFNLSIWYKLTDKTMYGAYFSTLGFIITLVLNVIFVPLCNQWFGAGYFASAGASTVCFFIIMLLSYFIGQKHFPVKYELGKMGIYFVITALLYGASFLVSNDNIWLFYGYRALLFAIFVVFVLRMDLKGFVPAVMAKFLHKKQS